MRTSVPTTMSCKKKAPFFPIFIDLSEKRVLLVGAGKIAARRGKALIPFAGQLTVIAPRVHPDLEDLEREGRVRLLRREFREEDLENADLVLAATDSDAVNEAVWAACRRRRIPVNVSSDREKCDFYFPGLVQQDEVVVGVTASGQDHKKARAVTERIREVLEGLSEDGGTEQD